MRYLTLTLTTCGSEDCMSSHVTDSESEHNLLRKALERKGYAFRQSMFIGSDSDVSDIQVTYLRRRLE